MLVFFFDSSKRFVACPVESGWKSCSSATVCTACSQNGFSVVNETFRNVCGDGVIIGTEQCDDRNSAANDGCSASCSIKPLWAFIDQPLACTYNGLAICGSGRVERGKKCDDGNLVSVDGCSNKYQREQASGNDALSNGSSTPVTKGFTLLGNVNNNINNFFIVLKTARHTHS